MQQEKDKVKYTILLPTYNGLPYVRNCIDSIINNGYSDFELLISDDHSTDGTAEYIDTLKNSHINVFHTSKRMSMAEHWEWLLQKASGEWQIFVGQDDGLQSYFFELADKLTEIAEKKKLRAIMSERAYYFWPGCEELYGNVNISYSATKKIKIFNSVHQAKKALLTPDYSYFFLPQMYTTSLFHKSLLTEIRKVQSGKIFTTHPQDANLAALCCRFEKKYLQSYIPLGWVGTSTKSAGMAATTNDSKKAKEELHTRKKEYLESIEKSKLPIHPQAGSFSLLSCSLYFWNALLMTDRLTPNYKFITNRIFKYKLFSNVWREISTTKDSNQDMRKQYFKELLSQNEIQEKQFKLFYFFMKFYFSIQKILISKTNFIKSTIQTIFRLKPHYNFYSEYKDKQGMPLLEASTIIRKSIMNKKLF